MNERLRWVLACLVGEAMGIAVAAGGFWASDVVYPEPRGAAARVAGWLVVVTAGAIEGAALGTATWWVLRDRIPALPAVRWIGAMIAVAAAGWAVGMLPSTVNTSAVDGAGPPWWLGLLVIAVGGAAGGAVVGAAQAWALRGFASGLGRWVVLNTVAWPLALLEIFAVAGLARPSLPVGAVLAIGGLAGIGSGLVVGLVTGLGLRSLTRSNVRGEATKISLTR
jgi:hypothetical protein